MGITLKDQGKLEEAIEAYKEALSIKPDYADAYYNMGNALNGVVFKKQNRDIQKIITYILDKKTYVRPKDLTSAAISLLKFDPNLQKYLKFVDVDEIKEHFQKIILDLSELPLLLKLMSVCPIPDLEFEELFKKNKICYSFT